MDPTLISELAKGGLVVLILGVIAWTLWQWGSGGNDKRIEEIKENNKLLAETANKSSDALKAMADSTDKQTEVFDAALKLIAERLSRVEDALSKVGK